MNETVLFYKAPWDKISNSLKMRIFFWIMVVWSPPVIAAFMAKLLTNETPDIGLFQDFSFHIRCLISIPILLLAEELILKGVNDVIPTSIKRVIIREDQINSVEKLRSSIQKLQNSLIPEIILFCIALLIVYRKIYIDLPPGLLTWRTINNTFYHFARWWNQWIGLTVYYFFVTRWFYIFLLWCFFIFKFSLLKPNLNSLHPDEMGGIAFLARRHVMFGLIATAISAVSSANIASSIIYGKLLLDAFYLPVGLYVAAMVLFLILPLFSLTPLLLRTKIKERYKFDSTANVYAGSFKKKWLDHDNSTHSEILGSPDFQSLNDLLESYAKLQSMRIFPINHRMLVLLIALIVFPLLPLGLLKIPLSEIASLIVRHFI